MTPGPPHSQGNSTSRSTETRVEVHDNPAEARYEAWADGKLAGFARYRLDDGQITFTHTEIDRAHEGAGLGSQLAHAALDDARARRLRVVPLCPFVASYVRRHPDQYLSLVVPSMRDRLAKDASTGAP